MAENSEHDGVTHDGGAGMSRDWTLNNFRKPAFSGVIEAEILGPFAEKFTRFGEVDEFIWDYFRGKSGEISRWRTATPQPERKAE